MWDRALDGMDKQSVSPSFHPIYKPISQHETRHSCCFLTFQRHYLIKQGNIWFGNSSWRCGLSTKTSPPLLSPFSLGYLQPQTIGWKAVLSFIWGGLSELTNWWQLVHVNSWYGKIIVYIIAKNIRWNRGALRPFLNTYLTFGVMVIRCNNHLRDSCRLTDVNPHVTSPGCRYNFKINRCWQLVTSSYMGQPLAIVTPQWPIVPMDFYGRMMLKTS